MCICIGTCVCKVCKSDNVINGPWASRRKTKPTIAELQATMHMIEDQIAVARSLRRYDYEYKLWYQFEIVERLYSNAIMQAEMDAWMEDVG